MSRIAFPLMAMFVVVGCRCVMPPAQQVVTRDLPCAQPRANQGGCFADSARTAAAAGPRSERTLIMVLNAYSRPPRTLSVSRRGGCPKSRAYSRLNCDGLAYPTS